MRPVRQEDTGLNIGGPVRGAAAGLLVTLVLLCVLAVLLLWVDLDDRPTRIVMDAVGGIGVLVAGFVAGRQTQARGLVHGGMAGALLTLLVLILGLLFFGASFSFLAWLLRLIAGIILGALGGMLGVNI